MLTDLAVQIIEAVVGFFVSLISGGVLDFLMALFSPGPSLV